MAGRQPASTDIWVLLCVAILCAGVALGASLVRLAAGQVGVAHLSDIVSTITQVGCGSGLLLIVAALYRLRAQTPDDPSEAARADLDNLKKSR